MKWLCISLLLLLLILLFPIKLKGKLIYNLFKNEGIISIYFYKLKLFVSHFKLLPHKILIYGKKKKDISFYFFNQNNQGSIIDIFLMQLIKQIKLNNFRTYANFGLFENAFASSIGSGTLNIMSGVANSYLVNKLDSECITSQIFADYTKTKFIMCFTSSIQLNLLIVIYCFLSSFIIKLKRRI